MLIIRCVASRCESAAMTWGDLNAGFSGTWDLLASHFLTFSPLPVSTSFTKSIPTTVSS